jgi:hypothetical protein
MKYIETYESIYSEKMRKLRSKFIGKYTIIKGIPDLKYTEDRFFMIYAVPKSYSGPINREYTAIIVAAYEEVLNVFASEEQVENADLISEGLIMTTTLEYLSEIALYITKKYNDCLEKLPLIGSTEKYNL